MVRQVIRHRFLDPDASAEVITQKLVQTNSIISCRSVERIVQDYGLQKKLFRRPQVLPPVETQRTTTRTQPEPADPVSLERGVRQLRAHYEGLPRRLASKSINPRIPWLYDFKLDFHFR